MIVIGQNLCER